MADIRINQLPAGGGPVATDFVPLDNGSTRKATVQSIVEIGRPAASQAEAEAGTNPTKVMTPLTTKQSIASEVGVSIASAAQGLLASTALQPAAIGTTVQAFDVDLTAIAGLTSAADKVPYATGAGTWALADFTSAGRTLVGAANAAAQRAALALGNSATLNVGTTAETVAAGDDVRIVNATQNTLNKTAVANTDPTKTKVVTLSADDVFYWNSADLSAWVTRDPTKSVLIPPTSDTTGASGAWTRQGPWQLGTVYATWFGVKADSDGTAGNGTDNAAAIQAAIDFVAPFVWKGTTRDTELKGNAAGLVILPKGIIRFASKIKAAPNLTLRGQECANDFTVRTGVAGIASGLERMGTALFADIIDFGTYAIDTCPYDNTGVRLNNATVLGGDSSGGLKTQVPNFRLESLTIYGNWTCKGINMAGAESCYIAPDVLIRGFTVGARFSASWYAKCSARILASWRGVIGYLSATDLDLSGASFWRPVEAPVYDPAVSGYDGTEPAIDSWWTAALLKKSAAIFNHYCNFAGFNVAVELFEIMFMSKSGVNDFKAVYTEAATDTIIFSEGPDQQNENYEFDTIVSSSAPLITAKNARISVRVAHHNNQNGYSKVIGDLQNSIGYEGFPVLDGVRLTGSDVFADASIAYGGLRQMQGVWTPTLKFGGAAGDTGTGTKTGRWVRTGNLVHVWFYITVPTKSAATGAATIDNLPFVIRNEFGLDSYPGFSFIFGGPAGLKGRGTAGGYLITLETTDAGFSNGADIRGYMAYETTEGGPWGW